MTDPTTALAKALGRRYGDTDFCRETAEWTLAALSAEGWVLTHADQRTEWALYADERARSRVAIERQRIREMIEKMYNKSYNYIREEPEFDQGWRACIDDILKALED